MHFCKKKKQTNPLFEDKTRENYIHTSRFLICKRIQEFKISF